MNSAFDMVFQVVEFVPGYPEVMLEFSDQAAYLVWNGKQMAIKRKAESNCRNGPCTGSVADWLDWLKLVKEFWAEYGVAFVMQDIKDGVADTIGKFHISHDDFVAGRFPRSDDAAAVARIEALLGRNTESTGGSGDGTTSAPDSGDAVWEWHGRLYG